MPADRSSFVALLLALAVFGPLSPSLAADKPKSSDEFLEQVAAERRAAEAARKLAAENAKPRPPTPAQLLLQEERVRYRFRCLAPVLPGPKNAVEPPRVVVDRDKAADNLVRAERRREEQLQLARVQRLLASARDHVQRGRLHAARRALTVVLKIEPVNREAADLLRRVDKQQRLDEKRLMEHDLAEQTNASFRDLDRSRVPHSKTLLFARDWDERTLKAATASARRSVTQADTDRAEVRKALTKTISLDALEMTVADVAQYLRSVGGVNIVVEKEAGDKSVTVKLNNVPLSSVLNWVTRLTGLGYTVRGKCVHIGPPEKVAEQSVVKVYDVADILHVRRALTRGHKMKKALANPEVDPWEEDETKSLDELAEDLIGFLKEVTGKDQWGDAPGDPAMNIRLNKLIVNAEPAMQEKILRIIESVRP